MEEKKPDAFSHALHNYNACNDLKKLNNYDDWVITTAFYSALKFMEAKLFPGEYEHPRKPGFTENFKSFSFYASAYGKSDGISRHKILLELVMEHIPNEEVANSYKDLKDACYTARYINYKVGKDRVGLSSDALEVIKNYCI